MATPYIQIRLERVPSTQDVARAEFERLPLLVIAAEQSAGRGRSGATWETAPRALAVSLAAGVGEDDRPFSLMAGVAACRVIDNIQLKWPNDLMQGESKVGGILVERSSHLVLIGIGINLWWPGPPDGYGSLFTDDPGTDLHIELGALWGAEMMRLIDDTGWPRDEYIASCATLGREITWEPSGRGQVIGLDRSGALVVETPEGTRVIPSGAVRHVR